MSGTKHLDSNKFNFTEKSIDDLYELGILNTDQMWQLREAYDLWEKAKRNFAKKSELAGYCASVQVSRKLARMNKPGHNTHYLEPDLLINKIAMHLSNIKGHMLTGRLYGKLRTCEDHLSQVVVSLQDLKM